LYYFDIYKSQNCLLKGTEENISLGQFVLGEMGLEKRPYVRLNFDTETPGRTLNVKQLVAVIKKQVIEDNHLKGCRLPPVRVLAHQLGVSKNTIQTAYEELKAQGLIESKDRTGLYVAHGAQPLAVKDLVKVPRPQFKDMSYIGYIKPNQKDMIYLSSVFVDPRILPKEKLAACFRSVLKSPGIPEFHDPQGMPALRDKIAIRLRDRGIDVKAEHIIITNGSQQALDLVIRSLSTKVVATEDPAYYYGKYLFEMNGLETIWLPIDPFQGLDEKIWEERISKGRPGLIYLTTNFQNPNGYSYSSKEIIRIVEWAKEYGFGILEDDWGSDILSFSEFRPGLRATGGSNVLYMNSFTKKLLPSLRIGYLVANDQTMDTLLMAKRVSTIAVPSLIEAALFEFLDRGYFDTHLRYIQEELDIRYEHCLDLLRELMPEEIKWTSPGGGPILWLDLPKKIDLCELDKRLQQKGVMIQVPTKTFLGNPHSHGFKVSYAFLNRAEMSEAIEKVAIEIKNQLSICN
jgi:GntR family transcriptional regulator/MocR family aminotransferase